MVCHHVDHLWMGGFTPLVIERFANWKITLVKLGKASCFCQRGGTAPAFWPFLKTHIFCRVHAHRTLRHWVGGVGMLTFMLTYVTCTSDVTSLGWGGGDVSIHVNLRHMHIWRYVTGLGGVGMLTFMLTCLTCTSDVTSLGWRGGDVKRSC